MNRRFMIGSACIALTLLGACSQGKRSTSTAKCAGVHFAFSQKATLHIGVMGDHRVSDSSCFRLMDARTGNTVILVDDPVRTDWDQPAAYTRLSVMESFVADIPTGRYVLSVPTSWTNSFTKQEIGLGTAIMSTSVGVHPGQFSGDPPRVDIPDGSL